jgi:hypothetical protein
MLYLVSRHIPRVHEAVPCRDCLWRRLDLRFASCWCLALDFHVSGIVMQIEGAMSFHIGHGVEIRQSRFVPVARTLLRAKVGEVILPYRWFGWLRKPQSRGS